MAFVVEDGTGLSTATAYIETTYADTHHADRGRTEWAAMSTEEKESAVIRATDYIEQRFGCKFTGEKQSSAQALEWPRMGAYDRDGHLFPDVPTQLQKACAEYALIAYRQGELAPQPPLPVPSLAVDGTAGSAEATGQIIKEKIGPIETEYAVTDAAQSRVNTKSSMVSDANLPEYPAADLWMKELLVPTGSGTLVRA